MHTPGPWTYSIRSDSAEIMQPGGMNVAWLSLRLLDINTSMSDVYLIAAAPELLEFLERLKKEYDAFMDEENDTYPDCLLGLISEQLEGLLAKAKGETT